MVFILHQTVPWYLFYIKQSHGIYSTSNSPMAFTLHQTVMVFILQMSYTNELFGNTHMMGLAYVLNSLDSLPWTSLYTTVSNCNCSSSSATLYAPVP